jgi:hypothetical protein
MIGIGACTSELLTRLIEHFKLRSRNTSIIFFFDRFATCATNFCILFEERIRENLIMEVSVIFNLFGVNGRKDFGLFG